MTRPTPEQPWPVRTVARKIAEWIDRLGSVWVEGQLAQVTARAGTGTAFLVLRDPAADVSLQLTAPIGLVRDGGAAVTEGSRVVVHGKPSFFFGRGTLSLRVDEIRAVGVGELLARIERLRQLLAAEGLFDAARKRRPPFLPGCIGLVTGRASAAEHDVVSNAQARWPAARFRIEHVATQGALAVPQIVDALAALDRDPAVDVIVLARGGGSVEDLLPFSDETLCRAVAGCRTPVVSAIGHEPDTPLVDHVADVRCSTPTEAGRRLVPDVAEETARVAGLRDRAARALAGWVDREERLLASLRGRPALADPLRTLEARDAEVLRLRDAAGACVLRGLDRRETELEHLRARLTTLGPAATLARGYAIVQRVVEPGPLPVLRSVHDVGPGTVLRIRVADGAVAATVTGPGGGGGGSAPQAVTVPGSAGAASDAPTTAPADPDDTASRPATSVSDSAVAAPHSADTASVSSSTTPDSTDPASGPAAAALMPSAGASSSPDTTRAEAGPDPRATASDPATSSTAAGPSPAESDVEPGQGEPRATVRTRRAAPARSPKRATAATTQQTTTQKATQKKAARRTAARGTAGTNDG